MGATAEKAAPVRRTFLGAAFETLVDALIRPPRAEYAFSELGASEVLQASEGASPSRRVTRSDFTLTNGRGLKLHGSWWRCEALDSPPARSNEPPGVIIFLHANSSCRVEALRGGVLQAAVSAGLELVAFDFAGSGWSEGRYITLGFFERYDVVDVVSFVVQSCERRAVAVADGVAPPPPRIVLWGRSMGATTALLYCQLPGAFAVEALVLDSPFKSVSAIVEDLVHRGKLKLPRLAARALLSALRSTTRERTGGAEVVDVDVLQPPKGVDVRQWLALGAVRRVAKASEHERESGELVDGDAGAMRWPTAPLAHCAGRMPPALLLGGRCDDFIPPDVHMDAIAANYGGDHLALRFQGSHNSARPLWLRDVCATFTRAALRRDAAAVRSWLRGAFDTARLLARAEASATARAVSLRDADLTHLRAQRAAELVETALLDELLVFGASLEEASARLEGLAACKEDLLALAVPIACELALEQNRSDFSTAPLLDWPTLDFDDRVAFCARPEAARETAEAPSPSNAHSAATAAREHADDDELDHVPSTTALDRGDAWPTPDEDLEL